MSQAVATDVDGAVLLITINRPQSKNAVNAEVAQGLAAAVDQLENSAALRVGVIAGADGTFCAGMDLKAAAAGEQVNIPGKGFAGFVQATCSKPLIAAVEGYALGGGLEIALNCDLIVAAEGARFGLPEVKRGLIAGGGGVLRLPKRLPYHLAMELLLTGDMFDAGKAAALGLVNQVVSDGAAVATAKELGNRIAANAPLALTAVKEVVRFSEYGSEDQAFDAQASVVERLLASADVAEGIAAFTQRREPVWTGR